MAIQFQCPGCRQPIEVDDEHAGQTAACPYCRGVITVPQQSTYEPEPTPPARPVAPEASVRPEVWGAAAVPPPGGLEVEPGLTPQQQKARTFGKFGLICGGIVIVLFAVMVISGVSLFVSKANASAATQPPSREDYGRVQTEVMAELQDKSWFLGLGCGSEFFAVAGLALSIASVVHSRKRNWPGIVGLIVCGLFVLCFCGGAAIQFVGTGGLPG